jgi:hypothetical protein
MRAHRHDGYPELRAYHPTHGSRRRLKEHECNEEKRDGQIEVRRTCANIGSESFSTQPASSQLVVASASIGLEIDFCSDLPWVSALPTLPLSRPLKR